jgi:tRNA U38,U39,U40 pseudouridine synthase TruA
VKGKTFHGWQKNRRVVKDVEQTVFDTCFEKFSPQVNTEGISSLTEDLMKFVMRYNE